MRNVLILGGTGWLGRAIAREALAAGADVTCLARGESGAVPDGARLIRVDRRDPTAYDRITGSWDAVIELSYEPDLVASALAALADDARHWTLVSTVSVYERNDEPGADESAALVEPTDLSLYPDAKVAAERTTAAAVADRLLTVRPGLIVGPGDPSDRFGYWAARLTRGGRMLTPDPARRFVQVVDVDDLATGIIAGANRAVTGAVNAVGPATPMPEFFDLASDVCEFEGERVTASDDELLAHDVAYWAGPRSLPLWLPREATDFAQRDGRRFASLAGPLRPLGETLARVRDDERERGVDRERRSGLTPTEERGVLAALGRA